jgi:hypothetical protein
MSPIKHISGKPAAAIAVALLGAASLVACGSGDYHPPPAPAPTPTPAPLVDAFYTAVSALVANSPEDTEPGAIEATVATAPEDTEPQPLG